MNIEDSTVAWTRPIFSILESPSMMVTPSLYMVSRESPLLPKFSGQLLVITRRAAAKQGTAVRKGATTGREAWRTKRSHSRPGEHQMLDVNGQYQALTCGDGQGAVT